MADDCAIRQRLRNCSPIEADTGMPGKDSIYSGRLTGLGQCFSLSRPFWHNDPPFSESPPADKIRESWGCSSAGRAPRSQRGGQRFDPAQLHHDSPRISRSSRLVSQNQKHCRSAANRPHPVLRLHPVERVDILRPSITQQQGRAIQSDRH